MSNKRSSFTKKITAIFFAAAIGLIGPLCQLKAFAEGEIPVRLMNGEIVSGNEVKFAGDIHLTFNNTVVAAVNQGDYNVINYASVGDIYGIEATYDTSIENFCETYDATLRSDEGFTVSFSCDNGRYHLDQNSGEQPWILPAQAQYFEFQVVDRSQNNNNPQNDYWAVSFDDFESFDSEGNSVTVGSHEQSLAGKTFTITAQNATITRRDDGQGSHYEVGANAQDFENLSFAVSGDFDPETMQITFRGPNLEERLETTYVGGKYVFNLNGIHVSGNISVEERREMHQGGGEDERPQHPGVPTTSSVTVTDRGRSNRDKSFYLGRISINDMPVIENEECEWNSSDDTQCPTTYTRDNITYNKEENVNTVEISFGSLFIYKYVGDTVEINGTEYNIPIDCSDRQSWLQHYDHQMTGFVIDNVPYATSYNIKYDVDDAAGHEQYVGNFLWSTDPREEFDGDGRPSDIYIGHAHLEVLEVLCHITENDDDDVRFSVERGDPVPAGCVFEYQPDDENNPVGSLVVPEGSEVTVRLKTDYGYQVTSFGSNGSEIKVDEGKVAQYTFGIFRGNFHLGAIVEATSDEVNAASDKVKSGTIDISEGEINEGTAMLTVEDAKLSDEERAKFQEQAGEYNVSTILNIDLDQIFYDGHGGYWKNAEMKELENEATITLELAEGIDGNDVILVHKKHDGSYEIIPTVYDSVKHTLTFKTSSFSDYAIASKATAAIGDTDEEDDEKIADPVKTFDDVENYIALMAIFGAVGTIAAIVLIRTKAARK